MKNKRLKLIILLTMLLIIIDQLTKYIIKYAYIDEIGNDFIKLTLIKNTGIALGINDGNIKNIILTVMILTLIINFVKNQLDRIDKKTAISLSLILGGGISNLIDRIINGGIIDFIKIKNFPIFNIADCYITIGWILLVIFIIKFSKEINEVKNCEKK